MALRPTHACILGPQGGQDKDCNVQGEVVITCGNQQHLLDIVSSSVDDVSVVLSSAPAVRQVLATSAENTAIILHRAAEQRLGMQSKCVARLLDSSWLLLAPEVAQGTVEVSFSCVALSPAGVCCSLLPNAQQQSSTPTSKMAVPGKALQDGFQVLQSRQHLQQLFSAAQSAISAGAGKPGSPTKGPPAAPQGPFAASDQQDSTLQTSQETPTDQKTPAGSPMGSPRGQGPHEWVLTRLQVVRVQGRLASRSVLNLVELVSCPAMHQIPARQRVLDASMWQDTARRLHKALLYPSPPRAAHMVSGHMLGGFPSPDRSSEPRRVPPFVESVLEKSLKGQLTYALLSCLDQGAPQAALLEAGSCMRWLSELARQATLSRTMSNDNIPAVARQAIATPFGGAHTATSAEQQELEEALQHVAIPQGIPMRAPHRAHATPWHARTAPLMQQQQGYIPTQQVQMPSQRMYGQATDYGGSSRAAQSFANGFAQHPHPPAMPRGMGVPQPQNMTSNASQSIQDLRRLVEQVGFEFARDGDVVMADDRTLSGEFDSEGIISPAESVGAN